jgi:putative integral membrane protein (TIGR02587 family)
MTAGMADARSAPTVHPRVAESLREYGRGLAGGLLFSLPMLYTMEIWWTGFLASPLRLTAGLAATFGLLILYNLFAGLREDASFMEVLIDSIEELGLGLVCAALLLWLLGRIEPSMNLPEIIGKIVAEGLVMAIGFSIGTAQLGRRAKPEDESGPGYRQTEPWRHLALGACGAVVFAANVAPTEEIVTLGQELSPPALIGLMMLSMLVGAMILHYSDFIASVAGSEAGAGAVVVSTASSYAVALLAAAGMLWFFGRFDDEAPAVMAAQTVVLGFASMLGASAGRLLLEPS